MMNYVMPLKSCGTLPRI